MKGFSFRVSGDSGCFKRPGFQGLSVRGPRILDEDHLPLGSLLPRLVEG